MSISRRQFLIGTASGLILPKTLDLFVSYLEEHGEPILIKPDNVETTLYAIDWVGEGNYQLQLDVLEDVIPDFTHMTIREFSELYMGEFEPDLYIWHKLELKAEDRINEDFASDYWLQHNSSTAQAYDFLYGIDLDLDADSEVEWPTGWIEFTEGLRPGDESRIVEVDELGLSLLQEKLNQWNYSTQIVVA